MNSIAEQITPEFLRLERVRAARQLYVEVSLPIAKHICHLQMLGRIGLMIHKDGRMEPFIHQEPAVADMQVVAEQMLESIMQSCLKHYGVAK